MLKRVLTVMLALMFVVGLSGLALAVTNWSDVDETGIGNIFDVMQLGTGTTNNWSDIDQVGNYNDATVYQHGDSNDNDSTIAQGYPGRSNVADVYQGGGIGAGPDSNWNKSLIYQYDYGYNVADVDQFGMRNWNHSYIYQYGAGGWNSAKVYQHGHDNLNTSNITQYGALGANVADVHQCGHDNLNTSNVTQYGGMNTGKIWQKNG